MKIIYIVSMVQICINILNKLQIHNHKILVKRLENAIEQGQTKDRQQDKGHEEYKDYEDTITKSFDNRTAESTLPQSKVNIDVDNTVLDYADTNTNTIKKRDKKTSETVSEKTGTKDNTFDSLRNGESDTKRNTQSQNEMNRTGLTKQYLIDNLQKLYSMRDTIFKTYDKECFCTYGRRIKYVYK
ncbi:adaptor [Staphylococcus phage S-CoN_Ph35]|nr:adaptor [Staphylococcus phage S-CoN_Ph35]